MSVFNVAFAGACSRREAVACANNCNFPVLISNSPNWVHNCWTTHRSGNAPGGYDGIELTFVNGYLGTNSEANGGYDFKLRAGILLNGVFYPATFDGLNEKTVAKEWGVGRGYVNVHIPANTRFVVTNRREAVDGGAAGTYSVLSNTSGIVARQDGAIAGTDNTKDFTLGVGVPYGAKALPIAAAKVSGGVMATGTTTVLKDPASLGTGYPNGGGALAFWYGPAGAGQPGAQHPGSGGGGFATFSGGILSSVSVSSGGSGIDPDNPPIPFIGGPNGIGFGGAATASYGPCLITGVPRERAASVLCIGDSNYAGFGSADGQGNLDASHGFLEQRIAGLYGYHKFCVAGESASGWSQNKTRQLAFLDAAIQRGLRPSHVILALGTNDYLTNLNSNALESILSTLDTISGLFRARGAKVLAVTIPPATVTNASSNKHTTLAEQSAKNANFVLNGKVMQHNAALTGAGGYTHDGVIDVSSVCRDATEPEKWRVDCYGGATAFCATESSDGVTGVHHSVGVGIPYLTANLPLPTFTV